MQHEVLLDIKCASFYTQGSALVATREKIDGTEAVHCCSITDFYCPLHSTRLMNPKDKLLDCAESLNLTAHTHIFNLTLGPFSKRQNGVRVPGAKMNVN